MILSTARIFLFVSSALHVVIAQEQHDARRLGSLQGPAPAPRIVEYHRGLANGPGDDVILGGSGDDLFLGMLVDGGDAHPVHLHLINANHPVKLVLSCFVPDSGWVDGAVGKCEAAAVNDVAAAVALGGGKLEFHSTCLDRDGRDNANCKGGGGDNVLISDVQVADGDVFGGMVVVADSGKGTHVADIITECTKPKTGWQLNVPASCTAVFADGTDIGSGRIVIGQGK